MLVVQEFTLDANEVVVEWLSGVLVFEVSGKFVDKTGKGKGEKGLGVQKLEEELKEKKVLLEKIEAALKMQGNSLQELLQKAGIDPKSISAEGPATGEEEKGKERKTTDQQEEEKENTAKDSVPSVPFKAQQSGDADQKAPDMPLGEITQQGASSLTDGGADMQNIEEQKASGETAEDQDSATHEGKTSGDDTVDARSPEDAGGSVAELTRSAPTDPMESTEEKSPEAAESPEQRPPAVQAEEMTASDGDQQSG